MKEIPMPFQTPMVQSLLNGNKLMTRRTKGLDKINEKPDEWRQLAGNGELTDIKRGCFVFRFGKNLFNDLPNELIEINCPYGKRGDKIWTKETFQSMENITNIHRGSFKENIYGLIYKADYTDTWLRVYKNNSAKWKPSLFMPKSAARIFLEITNIRVERLQNITEQDAINEGIEGEPTGDHLFKNYLFENKQAFTKYRYISAYESFKSLWISINGTESWEKNIWVWVISFKIQTN